MAWIRTESSGYDLAIRGCSTAPSCSRTLPWQWASPPTPWKPPRRRISLDEVFLRLETAGVMLRIDRDVTPTMAKVPTLGLWELDLLRTISRVVRYGHIQRVTRGEIVLDSGRVPLPADSLVVHCAASGLAYPPMVPVWGPDMIRLQTIRAGFPCFGAALAGYVEATRDDDRERNRLCPPNILPDDPASWARMQVRGTLATREYSREPDIANWVDGCALNPARIDNTHRRDPSDDVGDGSPGRTRGQGARAARGAGPRVIDRQRPEPGAYSIEPPTTPPPSHIAFSCSAVATVRSRGNRLGAP